MINLANISRLDLNLLIVFYFLMNERSVTRTAVLLCVSQGAVSSSLKRLREIFKDELFIRSNQAMIPTNFAMELAPKVAFAINAVASINPQQEVFDPIISNRVFKIALSDDLEGVISKFLLKYVSDNNFNVKFSFYQTSSQIGLHTYEQHNCDLLVCSEPKFHNCNFTTKTLFSSSYSCLFDPKYYAKGKITSEEYFKCKHIRVSYDARRGFIDDLFENHQMVRNVCASFTHFSGAMTAVIDTDLVATIPTFAAKYYSQITDLNYCPVPIHVPSFRVFAIWNTNKNQNDEVNWLINLISSLDLDI